MQNTPIQPQGKVGPGAHNHGGIDAGERCNRHEQAQGLVGPRAKGQRHQIGSSRLALAQALQPQTQQKGQIHQQVNQGQNGHAGHDHPSHGAGPATHLGRHIGRLVPPPKSQQDKHQAQAPLRRGWRLHEPLHHPRLRRLHHETGHHHGCQPQQLEAGKPRLQTGRCMEAQQVDCRQSHHHDQGPPGARELAQPEQRTHVIAKHKRQQGNGACVDPGRLGPGVQARELATRGVVQEMIVTACVRISGAKLGVAQGATDGNERTDQPHDESPAGIAADACDQRRRLENASPHHHAHDQQDGSQRVQQTKRGKRLRIWPAHGPALSEAGDIRAFWLGRWISPLLRS